MKNCIKNNKFFYSIEQFFRHIINIIKSTHLCIKYPFLYPRNVWTDKHYNNWKIIKFHRKWYCHTEDFFFIRFTQEKPDKYLAYQGIFDDRQYVLHINDGILNIQELSTKKTIYSKPLSYFGNGTIKEYGWYKQTPYIIVGDDWKDNSDINRFVKYVHAPKFQKLIKFLDWINDNPLQLFHCLTSYTLLDCMPTGWRKAFGIEMCKDIKQTLLDNGGRKALRKYRVIDIKEKFGGLRWYDNGESKVLFAIINYYENLSYTICIKCGKPAKYVSKGWISPYCEDCSINKDEYVSLAEEDAWDKALGYY